MDAFERCNAKLDEIIRKVEEMKKLDVHGLTLSPAFIVLTLGIIPMAAFIGAVLISRYAYF